MAAIAVIGKTFYFEIAVDIWGDATQSNRDKVIVIF